MRLRRHRRLSATHHNNRVRFAQVWDIVITSPGSGIQLENVGVEAVPEPSTLVLWLAGLAFVGISLTRRRNQKRAA